jgi:hypothetical protein
LKSLEVQISSVCASATDNLASHPHSKTLNPATSDVLCNSQGLKSLDVQISSACASAIDNLATFYFRNVVREPESGRVPAGALVS